MMLKVTDVEYMGNYALLCRFNNGLQRYVRVLVGERKRVASCYGVRVFVGTGSRLRNPQGSRDDSLMYSPKIGTGNGSQSAFVSFF